MNKFKQISLGIITIGFLYIIGIGFHQFFTETAPWVRYAGATAGFDTQTSPFDINTIIATKTIAEDGTISTTSVKTTSGYTCYTRNTQKIGQVDTELFVTPFESGTHYEWQIFKSLDGTNFYNQLMQTNSSSTAVYRILTHIFDKEDDGSGLVASTTYALDFPRDYSGPYYRLCIKEVNVTSAFGDIFAEQIFSANNLR